jgi:GntR family transcriptional regulator of vanillate catabolism
MPSADDAGSQSTRALLRLRQLLLDGEYPPGARLSELPLVERLGLSRTPLRHALSTLAHEGLLEASDGGGYRVRTFTRADIDDAIELRGVLEGTAARRAAERRPSAAALEPLHAVNRTIEIVVHAADYAAFERYLALNEEFHRLLLGLAGSPVLERALGQILALPFASPSAFVLAEAELPESREILVIAHHQHRELVGAIAAGEGARAEHLGREHARLARRNLDVVIEHREVFASLPGASLLQLPD